jgi:tRNA threonylcarbamoyladenosine biosynthesis protein TsaE
MIQDVFLSKSPADTVSYAESFAASLRRNDVVLLIGELGSGKTQFVRGICRHFRVKDLVSSPTFVMLHRYCGRDSLDDELLIYHFDLYRINGAAEILELGYEEFFRGNGVCLLEWGDRLGRLAPGEHTEIRLSLGAVENERRIEVNRVVDRETEQTLKHEK